MIIKENEPLMKYTTFRMGGIAKKLYFPETISELCDLIKQDSEAAKYIIGGGSNLLINDSREFESVICLREFNSIINNQGNGHYYVGASVRLQKLIKTINADGYGGIEYLFSVPGLVGGAVYMNAGRGKKHNKCISDYIISVDVLIDGVIRSYNKNECNFAYRTSIFQNEDKCIIIGANFMFEEMTKELSSERIQERKELCKKVQDMSLPNYGTVFCISNKYIMAFVKKIHMGFKKGCMFSSKTNNWMLHGENGTFEQAIGLIERVKKMHKLFHKDCKTEVRIWY